MLHIDEAVLNVLNTSGGLQDGLEIDANGYNDKIMVLLKRTIDRMVTFASDLEDEHAGNKVSVQLRAVDLVTE